LLLLQPPPAPPALPPLSLHDALPILLAAGALLLSLFVVNEARAPQPIMPLRLFASRERAGAYATRILYLGAMMGFWFFITQFLQDRKSTRLNSSHVSISYAVFCLKKK